MKRIALIIFTVVLLVGCQTTSVPVANKIPEKVITNQVERLQVVGALSEGIEVSLDKSDIPAATDLNAKIQQIAETPTPQQVKQVTDSLDNSAASKELEAKITQLIEDKRSNEQETRLAVGLLTDELAKVRASKKAVEDRLAELSNPITAIWYGVKTLIKRLAWTLVGCGAVFFLLKIFAASNPVVGAIFDVIQRLVGYIISAISSLFPMAIKYGSKAFQRTDDTLTVVVDAIQALPKTATIADLREQLAKDTDEEHRAEIDAIKRRLNW
jgi:hypothetical protein